MSDIALVFAVLALACAVIAVGLSINDALRRAPVADGLELIPRAGSLVGFIVFAVLAIVVAVL